jgi:hypothetical protein
MRTPQTLNGPVVGQPTTAKDGTAQPVEVKPVKKATAPMKHGRLRAVAQDSASGQPGVSAVK